MKRQYQKPEIEMVKVTEADVLVVSFDPQWGGSTSCDFDLGWLSEKRR